MSVLTAVDYGTDISTFSGPNGNDLDPTFTPIYGRQAVGEAVARRLLCAPGSLLESPGDGLNVRAWLNKGWTPSQLRTAAGDVEAECLKDERVQDASASVVLVGDTLTISVSLVTAAGPFALVLTVQALAVSLQILDQS